MQFVTYYTRFYYETQSDKPFLKLACGFQIKKGKTLFNKEIVWLLWEVNTRLLTPLNWQYDDRFEITFVFYLEMHGT